MTDSIIERDECPRCHSRRGYGCDDAGFLSGAIEDCPRGEEPYVTRTYIALDELLRLPRFISIQQDREGYTEEKGWPHADPMLEACIPVRLIEDAAKDGAL